jgi:hypothetical protein
MVLDKRKGVKHGKLTVTISGKDLAFPIPGAPRDSKSR